jgi:hypothetical protein
LVSPSTRYASAKQLFFFDQKSNSRLKIANASDAEQLFVATLQVFTANQEIAVLSQPDESAVLMVAQ